MTTTLPATYGAYSLGEIKLDEAMAGPDGFTRSWIMLLPEGEYDHPQGQDGVLKFSRAMLGEVKRNFDSRARHVDIALDYDHKASSGDSRAFGWIEDLQFFEAGQAPVRDMSRMANADYPAGLWAKVKWTRLGLSDVKDQIYRYVSAEFKPEWTDPVSKKHYRNVLIGAALTNRPFMAHMPAIQLSEVSTKSWGSVDKSKLPDSAFLDPKNRRLPVYEGAGAIGADGRYSSRGKLNIHGVKAALAAIHGARSGKPMSGLPAGIADKLQGWLDKYSQDGSENEGQEESAKMGVRETHLNKLLDDSGLDDMGEEDEMPSDLYAEEDDENDYELDDTEDEEDEADNGDDEEEEGEAGESGETQSPRNSRSRRRMGRKKEPVAMSELNDSVALAEVSKKLAESEAARTAAEDQARKMAVLLHENAVEKRISNWTAPANGDAGPMVASTAFINKYREFMQSQGILLSEDTRTGFDELLDLALQGSVELGQRSLAEMEDRSTRTIGKPGTSDDLMKAAERIAMSEAGEAFSIIARKAAKGETGYPELRRDILVAAMKETHTDARSLGISLAESR